MSTDLAQGCPQPVWIWGVPFTPLTFQQTLDQVGRLIEIGEPAYFITANLHYAMLCHQDPRLAAVNEGAAFVLADGMPIVWASRRRPRPLPERVAGSDLVPALCERAALCGWRVFLLGGVSGVGEEAARRLCERFPQLQIAGVEAPPFRERSAEEEAQLVARIRAAKPDILFVAFGQPKGEIWLAQHYRDLGVPACAQIGASLDFVAGRVSRAPRWMQRIGLEWAYRLFREPLRLAGRYTRNALFLLRMLVRDAASAFRRQS
jgi:N-acetylglucosaminyldiphosphoundecaprenol N-acetyl-beta-D-mannosaminyltransferase